MAFCRNCGTQLNPEDKFCPNCGTRQIEAQAPASQPEPQPQPQPEPQPQPIIRPEGTSNNVHAAEYDEAQDIAKNNVFAVFAYLSWLVLIPLLAAKDSKFARFHANQGLVLAITEIVLLIVRAIVVAILSAIVYAISWRLSFIITLVSIVFVLLFIALAVFSIMGIVNAATGKFKELPIIGKIKILK